MKKIIKFFILLAAIAVILLTLNFIYLYAQNKEAGSLFYKLGGQFLELIK
jgi:hypothetical protein